MLAKLTYLWRLVGTAFAFAVFGIGSLALAFLFFPPVILLVQDGHKKKRIIRYLIQSSFKLFIYFIEFIGLFELECTNIESLMNDRGHMIIANHPSLLDVVVIIAFCPNPTCIVKKELWNNPFLKGVVQAAGYIPNHDPENILEKSRLSLLSGENLIIFPEGTRTQPFGEPEFKRGAAQVALHLDCPVRCLRLECQSNALSKHMPWFRIPSKKIHFRLQVLHVIHPKEIVSKEMPRSIASRRLTKKFLNDIYIQHEKH